MRRVGIAIHTQEWRNSRRWVSLSTVVSPGWVLVQRSCLLSSNNTGEMRYVANGSVSVSG